MTNSSLITPLLTELIKQKVIKFVGSTDFIRLMNTLNISELWQEAKLKIEKTKRGESDFYFLLDPTIGDDDIFKTFTEIIFERLPIQAPRYMSQMLITYLNWTSDYIILDKILLDLKSLGLESKDEYLLTSAWADHDKNQLRKINLLKSHLLGMATNGPYDKDEYIIIRESLIKNSPIKKLLPSFVIENRTLDTFWPFIKMKFSTYQERRNFIELAFDPLYGHLESTEHFIPNEIVIDDLYIREVWDKALQRLQDDPEAAITSSRTLIEAVCKHILDSLSITYDEGLELPKLYKIAASQLNLSPDQHTAQIFKQILSGCQSVVEGLGSLRNKLGDAHGKGQNRIKPSQRHANLAVNLSGSLCQFLLQTLNEHKTKICK